jgi:hypothetical protein
MKDLIFPEISKEIQQSVFGAWGGSNSNEPPNGGWYDNGDGITIISNGGGGSGGSGGSWGDIGGNGGYDNGGYWGDQGGSGGGGGSDNGDNHISPERFLNVAEGDASAEEFWDVDSKVRAAVNSTGLAAGFTGTAMDGLAAITKEIGFTVKTFGQTARGIGAVSVAIGGAEVYFAATEAISGENPWTQTDTLNTVSTILGGIALVPGPHSIICGGLSIAIGLVGTAYSQN